MIVYQEPQYSELGLCTTSQQQYSGVYPMAEKMRVLIVHTDEQDLIGLEQSLEDCGLSATTTWDAREAIQLLRTMRFDLVVVGDRPPVVSASDLLAVVRSSNGNARCVVLKSDKSFAPACLAQVENRLKRAS